MDSIPALSQNPISDQARPSGTDDVQVIIDMHSRLLDLWVEIDQEDIDVAHLKPTFSKMNQQIDSLPISQQIARLSKMVQILEKILSKNKERKKSESASIVSESKAGASAISKLSMSKSSGNIPGASAAAFPTARPDSDSEVTEPCSSGKRTAVQAALADLPNHEGENCRRVAVEYSVPADGRRKRRSLPTVQQAQLETFVTFAVDYFRKKALELGVNVNTRHTTSMQLVSIYNGSLTCTDKEQGLEFSMLLFKKYMVQLRILQRSRSPAEAMLQLGQSRINYGHMTLERYIAEKPDVADVIYWCQKYSRNRPDQILTKNKVLEAMALESQRLDTRVPNGSTRLRTLFSNGMITMKKLKAVWRLGCSDANYECYDGDGEPPDESAAGSCCDREDGGGGGDGGDGGGCCGPSAGGAGGGGEEDGGAGGPAAGDGSSNSN